MFFKLQKYFTVFKKFFLTDTEMQILTETQIPRDFALRRNSPLLKAGVVVFYCLWCKPCCFFCVGKSSTTQSRNLTVREKLLAREQQHQQQPKQQKMKDIGQQGPNVGMYRKCTYHKILIKY